MNPTTFTPIDEIKRLARGATGKGYLEVRALGNAPDYKPSSHATHHTAGK